MGIERDFGHTCDLVSKKKSEFVTLTLNFIMESSYNGVIV